MKYKHKGRHTHSMQQIQPRNIILFRKYVDAQEIILTESYITLNYDCNNYNTIPHTHIKYYFHFIFFLESITRQQYIAHSIFECTVHIFLCIQTATQICNIIFNMYMRSDLIYNIYSAYIFQYKYCISILSTIVEPT